MNTILSTYSASVSELKKNPSLLLKESGGEPVAILKHNKPTAYLIPAATYENMLEALEDTHWLEVIEERKSLKSQAVEMTLDEL